MSSVLVTGASSGFGAAIARRFAREAKPLILAARRQDRLDEMAEELGSQTRVHTVTLDVRERQSVQQLAAGLPADFQPVSILINNAGLALGLEAAHEALMEDWETMVDTNIKGLMYCTRALLPLMVQAGAGHIVNLGSVAGNWPYPGGNVYGATKAFVHQFSRNLRSDLGGKNIRVTSIEPGMSETEFSVVRFRGDEKKAGQVYAGTRSLAAEDIAELVWFVTSLPAHMNINSLEVMPTCQSWAPFAVDRKT